MAETTKAATTALPKLAKNIFDVKVENHELLKIAYDGYLANGRKVSAKTLERGDVRGGGKKPWRQKGTGRARFGSSRNPIWRGGGVVFGPNGHENYTKKLSKAAKQTAIRQALSLANRAKKIVVKDIVKTTKTADVAKFLADNKLDRRVLLVVSEKTADLTRATANLQNVILTQATYLNVFTILNADYIVIAPKAVALIEAWLAKEETK